MWDPRAAGQEVEPFTARRPDVPDGVLSLDEVHQARLGLDPLEDVRVPHAEVCVDEQGPPARGAVSSDRSRDVSGSIYRRFREKQASCI